MYSLCLIVLLTSSLESSAEVYGRLKSFRLCFPSFKLFTLRASKNLSKLAVNFTVSVTSSLPLRVSALDTDSLRTYTSQSELAVKEKLYRILIASPVRPDQLSFWSRMWDKCAHIWAWVTVTNQEPLCLLPYHSCRGPSGAASQLLFHYTV